MINETFLRQSVRDLNNEINVYIYNDKFIDVIAERYYKKYKKPLYLEKNRDYFILTTKKRKSNQIEIIKK